VDLGGSLSLFAGFKFSASLSESFELSFGPSAKFSVGEEYRWKLSGFSQHVKDGARLHSDDSVLVIGGSGGGSGVMEASKQALTLQFAPHRPGFEAKTQAKAATAVAVTSMVGVAVTAGASAYSDWATFNAGNTHNSNSAYGSLGAMVPAMAIDAAITAAVLKAVKGAARTISRATIHGSPHARITLNNQGVKAEAAIGAGGPGNTPISSPLASLELTPSSGGKAILEATTQLEAKSGVIKMEAESLVYMKARMVTMEANNILQLKGNSMVRIG